MSILLAKAQSIHKKIQRADGLTAVFLILTPTGTLAFRTCSVSKKALYERALKDLNTFIVGLYDLRAQEESLLDDMDATVEHAQHALYRRKNPMMASR